MGNTYRLRWVEQGYVSLLNHPKWLLFVVAGLLVVGGFFATRFSFDASSETLVVEGDPDLAAYERVSETFGGDAFLLLTFAPHDGDPLSAANLERLWQLQNRVLAIDGVMSVFSLLDAPLLSSPPIPLEQLADGFRTLRSPDVDKALAANELRTSPLFRELLISNDGNTTAMRIDIAPDVALNDLEARRATLRNQAQLTDAETGELELLDMRHPEERQRYLNSRTQLISEIRHLRTEYSEFGLLHLGGVPMIAADMIQFVKNDLIVFGGTVIVLIMIILYLFFGSARWVLLPIAAAGVTIVLTMGVLGFLEKPATVISSNFVSLLAITTISLTIHLIVRYRELLQVSEELDSEDLVEVTMTSKFAPCLYTALTTIAAFGSLTVSDIVPVEDFGWMMCLGIAIAFVVTFSFFPAALLLMGRAAPLVDFGKELGVTRVLSHLARWQSTAIVTIALVWSVAAIFGISRVSLDNRFVDYFQDDTDISQGMTYIDQHLGGTVPFDVVLKFEPFEDLQDPFDEEDDLFGDTEADTFPERYWFTRDKLDRVQAVHRFLEAREEVGKVVSLASLDELAAQLNGGQPLNNVQLAAVLGALPVDLRDELIRPYGSPATGEVRLSARVIESGPHFDRDALVTDILTFSEDELHLGEDQVVVSGMLVLFNSMLQQLFSSQVDTLAYVLLAAFAMFVILLRSVLYAVLGLIPNILAAATVIAFMGYAGIPLDMMTITIAAISIGIGVDNAIHYLHRFRIEHEKWGDVRVAIAWSHASIGRALYFTGFTIITGFSVLCFSNFVPTIMFGLLIAVAMVLALLANLTLLPSLLVLIVKDHA